MLSKSGVDDFSQVEFFEARIFKRLIRLKLKMVATVTNIPRDSLQQRDRNKHSECHYKPKST